MYSQEVADKICSRLAEGDSLRAVCREEGMPNHSTVLTWARENTSFANQYAQAREDGIDAEFEGLDGLSDVQPERDDRGKVDPGWVQYQRLRIDTRKWTLARKAPKKYGDKVTQEHTGAGGGPIQQALAVTISPEEAYKRMLGG